VRIPKKLYNYCSASYHGKAGTPKSRDEYRYLFTSLV
jgi:hypothetical protein